MPVGTCLGLSSFYKSGTVNTGPGAGKSSGKGSGNAGGVGNGSGNGAGNGGGVSGSNSTGDKSNTSAAFGVSTLYSTNVIYVAMAYAVYVAFRVLVF
jgi:hypothetical protein